MTNTPQIDLHEENIEKKTIRRQHCKYFINITSIEQSFKSLGQSQRHLLSKLHIKMLAKVRPNGDPTTTPSTCLHLLLNVKKDSLVAMLSKLRKS